MKFGSPVPFSSSVVDATGGNIKIQQKDYLLSGALSVIDQGQDEVAGYTNDTDAAFKGELPVILFGDHTRAFKYVDTPFALGADGVKVLAPKPGFNAKFLYYYFLSCDFPSRGYSRHFKYLKQLDVPYFAPLEQAHIVEILDDANRLCRLRREADAKTARILPALFVKMFGDPVTNPMGWQMLPLSSVIDSVNSGWSAPSGGRPSKDGEFGVLKVSAVTSGRFRPEENKVVSEIEEARTLLTPKRGDLLFSRANTRELIAASCIVEQDYPTLFLSDKLWRITPKQEIASAVFLKELFWQGGLRDKFRASSSGSSASMLNISKDAMLKTMAPIPPIDRQMKFEEIAWSLIKVVHDAASASYGIEKMRAQLMQLAFSGQLTAKWRQAHMQELLAEMQQQHKVLNLPMTTEGAE